jgi:anion-transporting  ArsA/GET3 family ATPase
MISGKGGVGKTSLAASLACRLAEGLDIGQNILEALMSATPNSNVLQ